MFDKDDFFISSLNRASYFMSSFSLGSVATGLLANKELIFIVLGMLGGLIGLLTFLTSFYFQIQRNKRELALFNAESELVERRLEKEKDTGQRFRESDGD